MRDAFEARLVDIGVLFSRDPLESFAAAPVFELDSFIFAPETRLRIR
jgi:hypothetical protein